MQCPNCKTDSSSVIDSRQQPDHVNRRRWCPVCGHRFSTIEISKDEHKKLVEAEDLLQKIKDFCVIVDTSRTEKLLGQ